jgi:hypothetical protein
MNDERTDGGSLPQSHSGVRPFRIRGYYRALKRGEQWAVSLSKASPLAKAYGLKYGPYLDRMNLSDADFYGRARFGDGWQGGFVVFPLLAPGRKRSHYRAQKARVDNEEV